MTQRSAPVNKSDLIAKVTERLSGDRSTAVAAVNGVLEEIEGSVARGERVSLTGFGTFERRERAPRAGRNPRTGETIQLGPSVVPVFRAGIGFKTLVTEANGHVAQADGKKSRAASSASSPSTGAVDAYAAEGKKAGKKAGNKAGKKDGKSARKAAKEKAGKDKAGKGKAGKK
jgi:DNA-binding protein HU-beta